MNGKIIEFDKNSSTEGNVRCLRQSTAAAWLWRTGGDEANHRSLVFDETIALCYCARRRHCRRRSKRRRPVFALASFDSHFAPVSTVSKQVFKPASERAAALKACLSKL